MTAPPTGTIDITTTVEALRKTWVSYMVAVVMGVEATIPGLEWTVTVPVISTIDKEILTLIFDFASKQVEMLAFFTNTAIRKASQAKDFVNAVDAKESLPSSASPEDFANAEKEQMLAFRNFVVVTN